MDTLAGIAFLLLTQTGAFLFWGGKAHQMLKELRRQGCDHETRLRTLEGVKP